MSYDIDMSFVREKLNPNFVANEFCNLYYTLVMTYGVLSVMYLFENTCDCIYDNLAYNNYYDVIKKMLCEGISKMLYYNTKCSTMILSNDRLLIQVTGNVQCVTYSNITSCIKPFTETFILRVNDTRIMINKYIFTLC